MIVIHHMQGVILSGTKWSEESNNRAKRSFRFFSR